MLVGLKTNPSDTVKWGIKAGDGEVDPIWFGKEGDIEIKCGVTEIRFWTVTEGHWENITYNYTHNITKEPLSKISPEFIQEAIEYNESLCFDKYAVIGSKRLDFKEEGIDCVIENDYLICATSDGTHQGHFTDCNFGKSCMRYSVLGGKPVVEYKNSEFNWQSDSKSFVLNKPTLK